MPRKGQVSITLPEWVYNRAKRFFEAHKDELEQKRIRSVTGLISSWILENSRGLKRFSHINVYEDHATIMDRDLDRLVDVYFQNGKAWCEFCEEHDCDHTRYALSLPKVQKVLKKHGWIIEDGKVIRGPN